MSEEPADLCAKLTVEQAWEEALATMRAQLTVEQAWEEALATEAIWVAIRALQAANARAEDAAAAGETAGTVMAAHEAARQAAKRAIDAAGKRRVVLAMNANGPSVLRFLADVPGLVLFDAAGKPRAFLGVDADGPGVALFDAAGNAIWMAP